MDSLVSVCLSGRSLGGAPFMQEQTLFDIHPGVSSGNKRTEGTAYQDQAIGEHLAKLGAITDQQLR